jgi:hypothetical protein
LYFVQLVTLYCNICIVMNSAEQNPYYHYSHTKFSIISPIKSTRCNRPNTIWSIKFSQYSSAKHYLGLLFTRGSESASVKITKFSYAYITVQLHLCRRWLSGLAWPFGYICGEFYKTNLSWSYQLLDQVQYTVMATRTSYLMWSKDADAGKCSKYEQLNFKLPI